MSFEDYLKQGKVAREAAKLFRYSDRKLPEYAEPDAAQKTEILALAQAIARDIAAKFDAARGEQEPAIADYFQQVQSYWTAPVPFGSLPTPPPIALYQSLVIALNHWTETCRSFANDADLLAAAGAGEFKAYLTPLLDDAIKAHAKVQATPTTLFARSAANHGAGPGADPYYSIDPFRPPPPIPGAEPYLPPGMGMNFGGPMMPPGMGGFPPMGAPFGMMPGMPPGMFPAPPPMPTYPPYSGGPMMPTAPPMGSGMPVGPGPMTPIAPSAAPPGAKQPWQEEFDANAKRMKEDQVRRDAEHARFIAQIKS